MKLIPLIYFTGAKKQRKIFSKILNIIVILSVKAEQKSVIRFGGFASDKDMLFYSGKLHDKLEEKGITSYGHARFLGYNPPFQLLGRRNEIIIPVIWKAE